MAGRPATGKITFLFWPRCRVPLAALRCCGVSHGFWGSWRDAAVLPNVLGSLLKCLNDSSSVGRRLSPRDGAIIREVNDIVFADNLGDGRYWWF